MRPTGQREPAPPPASPSLLKCSFSGSGCYFLCHSHSPSDQGSSEKLEHLVPVSECAQMGLGHVKRPQEPAAGTLAAHGWKNLSTKRALLHYATLKKAPKSRLTTGWPAGRRRAPVHGRQPGGGGCRRGSAGPAPRGQCQPQSSVGAPPRTELLTRTRGPHGFEVSPHR